MAARTHTLRDLKSAVAKSRNDCERRSEWAALAADGLRKTAIIVKAYRLMRVDSSRSVGGAWRVNGVRPTGALMASRRAIARSACRGGTAPEAAAALKSRTARCSSLRKTSKAESPAPSTASTSAWSASRRNSGKSDVGSE